MPIHPHDTARRNRERAGVVVLLLGSVVLGLLTLAGLQLYQLLAILGVVVVGAWLVDGSNRRYMGPGVLALAVGGGMTIGIDVPVEPYERTVVYAAIGAALLLIAAVNPEGVRGAGAFLLAVAGSASLLTWVVTPSGGRSLAGTVGGWELAVSLALWAGLEVRRLSRAGVPVPEGEEGWSSDSRENGRLAEGVPIRTTGHH